MILPLILRDSELALISGEVYPWPEGSLEALCSDGVLLGGTTLNARGIKHVKPSTHPFLAGQTTTYNGFKIDGTSLALTNVGSQPHSYSVENNLLYFRGYVAGNTISLYRSPAGSLVIESTVIGQQAHASYLTKNRRGIKYVIIHICGAGGGGGGGGTYDGQGGGSGSVYTAIIDITQFTSSSPLIIEPGEGGAGGEGKLLPDNGLPGSPSEIYIAKPFIGVSIPGGSGGGGGSGVPGAGGGSPTVASSWEDDILSTVSHSIGNASSGQNGGALPNVTYTDPNPGATAIGTNQSFLTPLYGRGGAGGNGAAGGGSDGQKGNDGAVYIYY